VKRFSFWPAAAVSLLIAIFLGVAFGSVQLSPVQVWSVLVGTGDPISTAIVVSLRLPRVVLAALVGAGLAASGCVLQGVMRNPLAEPYLLGVSGGAAVGAVAATTLLGTSLSVVPLAAFAGAVVSVSCVLLVARAAGSGSDPRLLVMAGVVVGAFGNAVVMVLLAGSTPDLARSALWWMMGSVSEADWGVVRWLAAYIAGGLILLSWFAPEIDALALGEETAASLGVDTSRATWRAFLLASMLAAATVAAAGLVGFVGLVVPHIARAFGVRGHRQLLLASALAGAALLVGADLLARTATAPRELPLGAVTALIGVPYFLFRLRRSR
jgi:iron complex transport system permease protein